MASIDDFSDVQRPPRPDYCLDDVNVIRLGQAAHWADRDFERLVIGLQGSSVFREPVLAYIPEMLPAEIAADGPYAGRIDWARSLAKLDLDTLLSAFDISGLPCYHPKARDDALKAPDSICLRVSIALVILRSYALAPSLLQDYLDHQAASAESDEGRPRVNAAEVARNLQRELALTLLEHPVLMDHRICFPSDHSGLMPRGWATGRVSTLAEHMSTCESIPLPGIDLGISLADLTKFSQHPSVLNGLTRSIPKLYSKTGKMMKAGLRYMESSRFTAGRPSPVALTSLFELAAIRAKVQPHPASSSLFQPKPKGTVYNTIVRTILSSLRLDEPVGFDPQEAGVHQRTNLRLADGAVFDVPAGMLRMIDAIKGADIPSSSKEPHLARSLTQACQLLTLSTKDPNLALEERLESGRQGVAGFLALVQHLDLPSIKTEVAKLDAPSPDPVDNRARRSPKVATTAATVLRWLSTALACPHRGRLNGFVEDSPVFGGLDSFSNMGAASDFTCLLEGVERFASASLTADPRSSLDLFPAAAATRTRPNEVFEKFLSDLTANLATIEDPSRIQAWSIGLSEFTMRRTISAALTADSPKHDKSTVATRRPQL